MNNNILKSFSNFDEIQKSSLEPFDFDESTILKGKKMPINTISNGYKKVAEGKWVKVSEHGMTKREHENEKKNAQKIEENQGNEVSDRRKAQDEQNKHHKAAENLDDKEYDDAHVEGSGKKSEKDQRLSLIEKLIKQGFSPEEAKKQVDGDNNQKRGGSDSEDKVTDEQKHIVDEIDSLDKQIKKLNSAENVNNLKTNAQRISHNRALRVLVERKQHLESKRKRGDSGKVEKSYILGEYDHDEIQKSHITEIFGYGQNQIQISKTGKEIKSALQGIKAKEEAEKSKYLTQYTTILAQIGCEPTEDVEEYVVDGFTDKLGDVPKMFSWRECYNDSGSLSSFTNLQEKESANDICKLKEQYNRCVRKYIDCCKEIAQIDTMINNLEDSKKFSLTVKQATILGF